jgi:hypothetical protein
MLNQGYKVSEELKVKIKLHFAINSFNFDNLIRMSDELLVWPKESLCKFPSEFTCDFQFIKRVGQSFYILGRLIIILKIFSNINFWSITILTIF